MKKILFILVILMSFTMNVYADDNLYIKSLKINNGSISPEFDKYNNNYSVSIGKEVKTLEIEATYDTKNYEVTIDNNSNLAENKIVFVTIINKSTQEQNTYFLKIYTEDVQDVSEITNEKEALEIEEKKDNKNYAPIIGTICFLLIIVVYYFIFLK